MASLAVAVLAGCSSSSDDGGNASPLTIQTVSNRADLVSDGDALVRVQLPDSANPASLKVDVDGRDVSDAFAARTGGAVGTVTGVVTGLKVGTNVITASANGAAAVTLTVTNAPRGGPILSGPQVVPFVCATPSPQPASGNAPATNASGLSQPAVDAQCNIPTEFKLYYRTTASGCSFALPDPVVNLGPNVTVIPGLPAPVPNTCFKPYDPASTAPADLATTTTDQGQTVPYIVRVERGTMNRGIYDIAVLYDPAKPWNGAAPQPQWNGKLYYQFGSSTGQPRRQQRPQGSWTADAQLSRGYAVALNSMTDSMRNSNRVMMAETVMMMKEHITDSYGPIKFTMGAGCSGGSINSHMNISIAPGQLDGITIQCAFPDSETVGMEVGDCVLLVEAYQKKPWLDLMAVSGQTQAQINTKKTAINGHPDQTACHGWYNAFGSNAKAGTYFTRNVLNNDTGAITQSPVLTNNCELPNGAVYDPQTNPTGPRCNAASWATSIFGKVPGTPFSNDARDNVGLQYGLNALKSGAITAEEFVTLNELVGGLDRDSNLIDTRTTADQAALDIAYRAGIVLDARNYAKAAVVDMRGWDDSALIKPPFATAPSFPIHYVWRSYQLRDKLTRDVGDFGNHAMWRTGTSGLIAPVNIQLDAFRTMDLWLTSVKADTGSAPLEQKVRTAKPAAAADFCLLSNDPTQSVKVFDQVRCDADPFNVPHASPRQAAGGARTEDALKCQLKPLSMAEYAPVTFSGTQAARLQAVFAGGVCDWSKPGVAQQPSIGPLTFRDGPGGQPLGAPPVSQRK